MSNFFNKKEQDTNKFCVQKNKKKKTKEKQKPKQTKSMKFNFPSFNFVFSEVIFQVPLVMHDVDP